MPAAADNGAPRDMPLASLARRLLSLLYEALLLAALAMVGALPFMILARGADSLAARPLIQLYILALAGAYFIWQWVRGGRTLPMKTWRLKLVTREGGALTLRHGILRYLLAAAGAAAFGAGFLWALLDRDGLFLHDRLAGTKIVMSDE